MSEFEKTIRAFVEEDTATLEIFRMHMNTVAADIAKDVKDLDEMMSQLVTDTENVQTSTSDIMISLQFQDSVRQILEHIQEDLTKITTDISSLDVLLSIKDRKKSHQLEEDISNSYTMESERQAYLRATTKNPADNKQANQSIDNSKNEATKTKEEKSSDEDEITFF